MPAADTPLNLGARQQFPPQAAGFDRAPPALQPHEELADQSGDLGLVIQLEQVNVVK